MTAIWDGLMKNWPAMVIPVALFVGVLLAGVVFRRVLFRFLERWSAKTSGRLDDQLVRALRGPFLLWVVMLALLVATQSSELPERITTLVSKVLLVLWIISLTLVASRMAGALVRLYGGGMSSVLPVTTLTQSIASFVVGTIGVLIMLDSLHISVTPILTALGVGGLAVALALQDTLSNLFAGFYVTVANQVRVGDYVRLDTGQEGYVTDINWRSTTLRALANNLIVVPNSKLAQAIVTNFHLPEKRMACPIAVSVSYESDPEHVERVLLDEAQKGAKEIQGLLAEPPPAVRFIPGFGGSSLDFTLHCQVAEFVDQYLVQHEMRKRIFKRFRIEGLEIPFPIQTVYLKKQATAEE